MWDKRRLEKERWVGVILRNLPPDCTVDVLEKNLSKHKNYTILAIEQPQMIKNQKCTVVKV